MKVINTNNIEKWMFDYFEGNLSFHEKIELENFIRENPVYQTDFEAWGNSYVEEEPVFYANADALIKKGFFEDKKMLILFFFLIGTGILLRNLTPNTTLNTPLASVENREGEKYDNHLNDAVNTISLKDNRAYSTVKNAEVKEELNQNSSEIINENSRNSKPKFTVNNEINNRANVVVSASNVSLSNLNKREESVVKNSPTEQIIEANKGGRDYFAMYPYKDNALGRNSSEELAEVDFDADLNETDGDNTGAENSGEKEYKGGIVEYKKKKSSFSSYKSKTLSKTLGRMLSRDLLLTVYNNRLTLKSNQMTLNTNSSFVGKLNSPRLQANFESMSFYNQQDFNFSFDTKIKGLNAGFGLLASSVTDILSSKKQVDFIYGHSFNVGFLKLTPSVKAGVNQTKVNWSRIGVSGLPVTTSDSVDNNASLGYQIAPSILFELPFAYAGLQINDLYSSTSKFVNNYRALEINKKESYSIVLGTDYLKNIGHKFIVSPQMYIDIYTDSRQPRYTFSTTVQYHKGLLGVGYTNDKTFRGVIGFDIGNIRMAYNAEVDLDVYNVIGADALKHEIAVQYIISKKTTGILLYD